MFDLNAIIKSVNERSEEFMHALQRPLKPFNASDLIIKEWNPPYEKAWSDSSEKFFSDHFFILLVISSLYIPFVFGLQSWMKNRPAYDLRFPLIAWNFLLCTFSGLGAYFTLSPLFTAPEIINPDYNTLGCTVWCYRWGFAAQWVFWFDVSKIFEWLDTVFLILRKKKVIFLHWYHHIITWLFCWYCNQHVHYFNCDGYYFATMNYIVHTFMYGYYGLAAMRIAIPGVDFIITCLQIIQMVFGIIIIVVASTCKKVDWFGDIFGLGMYFSFFALFVIFFGDKYLRGKSSSEDSEQRKKKLTGISTSKQQHVSSEKNHTEPAKKTPSSSHSTSDNETQDVNPAPPTPHSMGDSEQKKFSKKRTAKD